MILSENGTLDRVENDDINADGSFNIPNNVTKIGTNAFRGCTQLKKITISNGITAIGCGAFQDCTNLEEIILPETILSIPNGVFWSCVNLKIIHLPHSLNSISDMTFLGCHSLQDIIINSMDNNERKRIIELLPDYLRNKVLIYSTEQLANLWDEQLNRITCLKKQTLCIAFLAIRLGRKISSCPKNCSLSSIALLVIVIPGTWKQKL